MRFKKLTLVFFVGVMLDAASAVHAAAPAMPSGLVLVANVKGVVTMTVNGATTALKVDDAIPQTATLNTSPSASTVLLFANGTTMYLGEDSRLVMDEFSQEPFSATAKFKLSELKEEPSVSRTKVRLDSGELVAEVKRPKYESSFAVVTPAGSVGVRGTVFQVVFRPTGGGRPYFALRTLVGTTQLRSAGNMGLAVPIGQQTEFSPSVASPFPTSTTPIGAGNLRRITAVLKEMTLAVEGASIGPPP